MQKLSIWKETSFIGKYELRRFSGSLWLKVFFHNMTEFDGFDSEEEVLSCNDVNKYSILNELNESLKQRNNKFEFLLEYPEKKIYNQWLQTNNPIDEEENSSKTFVEGFQSKHCGAPYDYWGGLAKSAGNAKNCALINGTPGYVGGGDWMYAIGMYKDVSWVGHKNLPSNNGPVNIVYLWVKVPMFFVHSLKTRCRSSNSLFMQGVILLLSSF